MSERLATFDLEALFFPKAHDDLPWRIGKTSATFGDLRRECLVVGEELKRVAQQSSSTRVIVACRDLECFVPALLGSWHAGLSVELVTNSNFESVRALRQREGVLSVLHEEEGLPGTHVPDVRTHALVDSSASLRTVRAEETLLLLHTSGTTAHPKAAEKSAREILGEVEALATTFASLPSSFLCSVPHHHLFGLLFGLLLPLRLGRANVDSIPLFPHDVARLVEAHGVKTLISTPAHLRSFVGAEMPEKLFVVSSGAPLLAELHLELAFRHQWTTYDVLGSTETGGIATRATPLAEWRPLHGVHVAAMEDGQMRVRSPWCPERLTGDRIRMAHDGKFELLGRIDDVVKVAGKRLELGALEATLLRVPGVVDAGVVRDDDPIRGNRILAAVVPKDLDVAFVRAEIAKELDPVLVPRRIVALDALPREASGKLRREELLAVLSPKQSVETPVMRELVFVPLEKPGAFRVEVSEQCRYFDGHFAAFPVLPGVVQLAAIALPIIRKLHPDVGNVKRLRRARFKHPIFPSQTIEVTTARVGMRVTFEFRVDGRPVASGGFDFEELAR